MAILNERPISRKSLAWLLVAQIFILAPHFAYAPAWIAVVWLFVAFWRWQIFQGAWNYPSKINKTLFVAVCCIGLVTTIGANVGFKVMVSLLLIGFMLKLLELKSRRDFTLLIFLGFFIVATQFIEFNHLLSAIYGFLCLILLSVLLMQLQSENGAKNTWQEIASGFYIVLQAIPFMLVLFVMVPRLGSFWAVPSPQQAHTGLSDSMSPGDFSKLMQSNELAFRVTFDGAIPSHDKLYWRSLVFSSFDGRRWSQSPTQLSRKNSSQVSSQLRSHINYGNEKTSYEIIAEPTNQRWLYALAAPESWSGNVGFTRDMRLQAFLPVVQRISYRATSSLDYQLHEVDQAEIAENLRLPATGNAITRERALAWMAETGSPEKLIAKLFEYYNQRFFYTLQPPALGRNVVDEFLWQSRQGFCEHFASSFVFFMRAAGVPARVVTGYQGGDINSVENYLAVRQRDAHAWAEVWLEGRGWVMFDPTAAVAPERVQKGIEESLSATDQQFLAKPFGSSLKIILKMREQWEAVNYQWTRWVMNYDSDLRSQLIEKLLGQMSPLRLALLVTGICTLLLILPVLFFLRTKQPVQSDAQLVYGQLCRKLAILGLSPSIGETPTHFLARAISRRPELAPSLGRLMRLFELSVYAEDPEVRRELFQAVKDVQLPKIKARSR